MRAAAEGQARVRGTFVKCVLIEGFTNRGHSQGGEAPSEERWRRESKENGMDFRRKVPS